MKTQTLRWIALTPICVAIFLGIAVQSNLAHAQTGNPTQVAYKFQSLGLGQGQVMRISVVNFRETLPPPCRVQLINAKGESVADSGLFKIGSLQTKVLDFDRASFTAAGDDGTGRLQLRAVVRFSDPNGLPP